MISSVFCRLVYTCKCFYAKFIPYICFVYGCDVTHLKNNVDIVHINYLKRFWLVKYDFLKQ